jgi:deazaflavin-dependent oxidoreductase (nitroreductase family)
MLMSVRYDEPHRSVWAANTLIRWLAEFGISIAGTRSLQVRGRKTGKVRRTMVNVLTVHGVDYLVSTRGNTQWARNVRAAKAVEVGPRWHRRRLTATEVADSAKPKLLRRYLDRWNWEVKGLIAGLSPDSGDDQLQATAPSIPVFALAITADFYIDGPPTPTSSRICSVVDCHVTAAGKPPQTLLNIPTIRADPAGLVM